MTKFLNISTDNTLGGNSPSDVTVSSQKAIKEYVDSQTGVAPAFANITGQPTDNANLASALNAKQDTLVSGTNIKTIGGNSLLGSGNIAFPTIDSALSTSSTNAVQNKVITSALNGKLDGFTLRFAGNWSGGVHAVNFVTIDYSGCDSGNGVFIKFSMVNSHGNGQAGRFLQDVVLNVKYTGEVAGTLYRYFAVPIDRSTSEYYGSHSYGDVFWVNDTTNKIVKFYVLMHQYSYTSQSPYFRLNASTKGVITQSSGGAYKEEYSSGTRVWATINWFETDQTYSATSDKPQSGVAIAGAGFLTSITGSMVTTALGYTPYNSTNPSGYQANVIETVKVNNTALTPSSKAVNITVPTKVSDLTNDSGFISGITSSDVTTALGYTPYNSSNPSGYQANVIETVKVNGTALTPSSKAVDVTVPTESTVSGWGFTKNTGTVTSVNNISPVNGNVSLSIPTVNNATLTLTQGGTTKGTFTANASSNVTIDLDAGGSIDVDNKSITTNASDQIQTVGVINSRDSSTAIKTWTGTKAQYDAIVTKDANTLYNITDDTDVTLPLLELLFPVGAVYFGTMDVCPLQVLGVGTWQALPQDKVIQIAGTRGSVGDTLNESLPNIKGSISGNVHNYSNGNATGAFNQTNSSDGSQGHSSYSGYWASNINFDASRSSSTYQNNAPVQPDAYLLNGWRRIS